jgi:ABC-2 type transport system ATP-binding protein
VGNIAVDIQDVSKRFRLYHAKYTSLKEKVIHAGRTPYDDLWALHNVSFEVKEGETVGVLGRNGSGKSTMLKCICGVLQPTSGQVVVRGKLAGLLELGAGFQPDLTGRENIFLNGSLLGLSKAEVAKVFDDIVAFAELEHFIDNQVKFYSSGMYVRLGFGIAVNVDPDVLVIDEVLAVGDERFQRKCIERVQEFQREGRTIIFVTHSPDQVRAICDQAVVLSDGRVVGYGPPGEAVRIFRENLLEAGDVLSSGPSEDEAGQGATGDSPPIPADPGRRVRLTEISTVYAGSDEHPYMVTGDALAVRVGFEAVAPVKGADFVIELRDAGGNVMLRADSGDLDVHFDLEAGSGTVEFSFESFPFLDGVYDMAAGIESRAGGTLLDWRDPVARIEVMNPGRATGTVSLPVTVALVPAAELP